MMHQIPTITYLNKKQTYTIMDGENQHRIKNIKILVTMDGVFRKITIMMDGVLPAITMMMDGVHLKLKLSTTTITITMDGELMK